MSDTSEPLSDLAEARKKALVDDPYTTDVKVYSVICMGCDATIKLSKKSLYDPFHWRRHKARCTKLKDKGAINDKPEGTEMTKPGSNSMVPDGVSTEADLNELNVAQLKARCKAEKLSGYSKLAKPLLVRKLLDHYASQHSVTRLSGQSSLKNPPLRLPTPPLNRSPHHEVLRQGIKTSNAVVTTMVSLREQSEMPLRNGIHPPGQSGFLPAPQSVTASHKDTRNPQTMTQDTNSVMNVGLSQFQSSRAANTMITHSRLLMPLPKPAATATVHKGVKRISSPTPSSTSTYFSTPSQPPTKKLKVNGNSIALPVAKKPFSSLAKEARTRISPASSFENNTTTSSSSATSGPFATFKSLLQTPVATKRFIPLVPGPLPLPLISSIVEPVHKVLESQSASTISHVNSNANTQGVVSYYLDFPRTSPMGTFDRLNIPPPLSRSRYVTPFSVFLSQVCEEDIGQCMLVSRMFRRAAYVSAGVRLSRVFAGKRLDKIVSDFPYTTFNLWPYLRQRQAEVAARRSLYERSFLGKFFARENPRIISPRLWTSPDNERQIVIALRFLLTRLFFSISVGDGDGFSWVEGSIVDAQEVIRGEIWRIVMQKPSPGTFSLNTSSHLGEQSFYVLESTCEVVGRPPESQNGNRMSTSDPVRADWSTYIAKRTSTGTPRSGEASSELGLISHLSWTNHEEYEMGMSKNWLKNIGREGELGELKRTMAVRYILACVVGNSISGRWMSSKEMEHHFSGMGSVSDIGPKNATSGGRSSKIHLFLPDHHFVESVHFTTAGGAALHPALAAVQTPGREYFVLRDNGMQVGCEEEGVASVWMGLIGCDRSGLASKTDEGGNLNLGME